MQQFLVLLSLSITTGITGHGDQLVATNRAVQCDAIIELNPPFSHSHVLLFARYWVASDYYQMGVVWAEPHGVGLCFPIYPPTLSFGSDADSFRIQHELYPTNSRVYRKPLAQRGVFHSMFGAYSIQNIRFAEQEALQSRVRATSLTELPWCAATNYFKLRMPAAEVGSVRTPRTLRVSSRDGRIDSIEFLSGEGQVQKSVTYDYEADLYPRRIHRQTVHLEPQSLRVGFLGEGLKVTVGGQTYNFSEFDGTYPSGERACTVLYSPFALGNRLLSVPTYVEVRNAGDGMLLRSVILTNFQSIGLTASAAAQAASAFAGFTSEHLEYRQLLIRYWQAQPDQVAVADLEAMRRLRRHFETTASAVGGNPGEELRRLNVLMELNRLLGDLTELDRQYEAYLQTLAKYRLLDMMLVGGSGVIETSMLWGRPKEADVLLRRWLESVAPVIDAKAVKHFAAEGLIRGQLWPTIQLIDRCRATALSRPRDRFEGLALRCVALNKLCELMREKELPKDIAARTQTEWVKSSIGTDRVESLLASGVAELRHLQKQLIGLSSEQEALVRQLDAIAVPTEKGKEGGKSR